MKTFTVEIKAPSLADPVKELHVRALLIQLATNIGVGDPSVERDEIPVVEWCREGVAPGFNCSLVAGHDAPHSDTYGDRLEKRAREAVARARWVVRDGLGNQVGTAWLT